MIVRLGNRIVGVEDASLLMAVPLHLKAAFEEETVVGIGVGLWAIVSVEEVEQDSPDAPNFVEVLLEPLDIHEEER